MILRQRRFARGALELNMPEVEIDLGDQGEVVGAAPGLARREPPGDRGVHARGQRGRGVAPDRAATSASSAGATPTPSRAKLDDFAEFARSLGFEIDQPQSRFELQRVLAETADKPEAYAVHYGLLRSLKQAVYTPEPEGHYALASDDYCHFTSPIRRYPDLQVHRQLTRPARRARSPRATIDELTALAEHCTRTERRAEAAERELIKIKLLTYLEDQHRRATSTRSSSASRTSASSAGWSSCPSRAWSTSPAWPTTTITSKPRRTP